MTQRIFLLALAVALTAMPVPAQERTIQEKATPEKTTVVVRVFSVAESGTQVKDVPQQAAAPPQDRIIVPDGGPLILRLVSELSSATARVGDAVQFVTAYPLRMNGLIVLPKGDTSVRYCGQG
jgi:hypothetical protein